ncbi:sulfotransferase domain-containing protein [Ornithinimicrobium murale]|uniref:sulfotransferase domain-containing protein n=1 Tax=Ornithinimicrobium murale TaxID=1050153 RepID=UPI003B50C30D
MLRRLGRSTYVEVGRRSAPFRLTPDFILIGGQRCGTTSLFRALMQHPQVVRPTFHKGINYFDVHYDRGEAWYTGHFPLSAVARRKVPQGSKPVAFEASGYYMFHPLALTRIARDLPKVRLVAMLRDPVERAFSAWKHEKERGFETKDFLAALGLEESRLAGEAQRMISDPTYRSFSHRHHAYRGRGEYLSLLAPTALTLGRHQMHIMYSEDFFSDPLGEFSRLAEFLGISRYDLTRFDRYNARPSTSMPQRARQELTEHFAPSRDALEAFVGRPAPWPSLE